MLGEKPFFKKKCWTSQYSIATENDVRQNIVGCDCVIEWVRTSFGGKVTSLSQSLHGRGVVWATTQWKIKVVVQVTAHDKEKRDRRYSM